MRVGALAAAFDRIYSENHQNTLEHGIVALSVLGFLAHLGCIGIVRNIAHPPALVAGVGDNYLAAIYTPFSLILFYEVLLLIGAIPKSTTRSLATQYEIVSLIFIRGFFKDIAALDLEHLSHPVEDLTPAFTDIATGLVMFLLVTIFRRASQRPVPEVSRGGLGINLERFIERKKIVALALTIVFVWLAVQNLWDYGVETFQAAPGAGTSRALFYSDVFTVMIFTDVLILLLSLLVTDRYESVFRNAAFVVSAILIRFSLTMGHPWGELLGVIGMLFGIFTLLIFNYWTSFTTPRSA